MKRKSHEAHYLGAIHKSSGHGRGGVSQMSILLHKPYLVKWSIKGEGVKNIKKNCPLCLWMPPMWMWTPQSASKPKGTRGPYDEQGLFFSFEDRSTYFNRTAMKHKYRDYETFQSAT